MISPIEIVVSQDRRNMGVRRISAISFIRRMYERRAMWPPISPLTAHWDERPGGFFT